MPDQNNSNNSGNNNSRRRNNRPYRRPQGDQGPRPQQGQGSAPRQDGPRNDGHQAQRHDNNRPQGNNQASQGGQGQGNRRPPYRRNNNRRSGRPLNSSQILIKYDNLLEQHIINRRKYFEMFYRVDYNQRKKMERNFFASMEQLRNFENSLEEWQKQYLRKKTERYVPDLVYSKNHDLPTEAEVEVTPEEIADPHFTDHQKEAFAHYKEDTEESVGSFEDYLQFKNSKN